MASTKVMMLRAKAAKQAAKAKQNSIDEHKFIEALTMVAHTIHAHHPEQDYGQTDNSLFAAKALIDKGITNRHLNQLVTLRETFEQALDKKYGAKCASGLAAIMSDQEQVLKNAKVPQYLRIMSGLLDTVISVLAIRSGHIQFHNVG